MKKGTKRTGWTPERRAEQAARIKAQKPWERSTGPTSDDGKAAASQNAYKHGARSADMKAIKALLTAQAAFVKKVEKETPPR